MQRYNISAQAYITRKGNPAFCGTIYESELNGRLKTRFYPNSRQWALQPLKQLHVVVIPQNGGSLEFCEDGHNAIIVDSSNFDEIIGHVSDLINDFGKREILQLNAFEEASKHFPENATLNFLEFL